LTNGTYFIGTYFEMPHGFMPGKGTILVLFLWSRSMTLGRSEEGLLERTDVLMGATAWYHP